MDEFETLALQTLLAGEHAALDVLREQLAVATVRDRERSEFGQWTDLWVDDAAPGLDMTDRFAIDDVFAEVEGVDEDVCLLVHVVRGRLKTLEASVSRPVWPPVPRLLRLWTVAPDEDAAGQLAPRRPRDLDFALRGLDPAAHEELD